MLEHETISQLTLPSFYRSAGLHGSHVYLPELVPNDQELVLQHGNKYAVTREDLLGAFSTDFQDSRYGEGVFLRAVDYRNNSFLVKMLKAHQDPEYFHQFSALAAAIQPINHPHLARVEASMILPSPTGEVYPAMLMDFYHGVSANRLSGMNGETIAPLRMARGLQQVADGLNTLHAHGIVHSDVAPKNIMFLRGNPNSPRALLTDFGAAFVAERNKDHPFPEIWTTPDYAAPEVRDGETPSFSSDQYSLGITAIELLGKTTLSPLIDIAGCMVNEPLPREISLILRKATATKPSDRFCNAREFGDELYWAIQKHVDTQKQLIV